MGEERGKQRWEESFIGLVDALPDRIRDATWTRGGKYWWIFQALRTLLMVQQVEHP